MDLPERLPAPLSERLSSTSSAIYNRSGREVDVAIGGIPFRLANSPETPQSFETVPVRKEQFDAEQEAGEQSLGDSWWRRSQSSFHEGAGLLYQEDDGSLQPKHGFFTSRGMDVFSTKGQFTLLRKELTASTVAGSSRYRSYGDGTSVSYVATTNIYDTTYNGVSGLLVNTGATCHDAIAGATTLYYIQDTLVAKDSMSLPGTPTTWPLVGNGARRMEWGKHRLWVIGGRRIWQPNLSTAGGTNQDPIFVHPNENWAYTCLAESGSAMLFGGHDDRKSSIQAVTLDQDGFVPQLSGAADAAVLPDGELVQEIVVLAGQLIGIGTSKGFRVGRIDGTRIVYGPLLFEPAGVTACTALMAQSRYFVVAFNSTEGPVTYRVDTGTELDTLIFPYAEDAVATTGAYVVSVAPVLGNGVGLITDTGVRQYQHLAEKVDTGYLQTGRIRYRTNERKIYKFLNLEIEPLKGQIQCQAIVEGGSTLEIGSITKADTLATDALAIQYEDVRFISLKFTMSRSTTDNTQAPQMNSYLLRAIPAVSPQHDLVLPLLCFDYEQGRSGQRYGGDGFSRDRIAALEAIEGLGDTVTFQDFSASDATGRIVKVESIRFVQTAAPTPQRAEGAGGIVLVTLRTMEA